MEIRLVLVKAPSQGYRASLLLHLGHAAAGTSQDGHPPRDDCACFPVASFRFREIG